MRLVPRQLQRVGMTGDVPYYGGRLTPAQAYAASHSAPRPPAPPPAAESQAAQPQAAQPPAPRTREESMADLQNLLRDGLISESEYRDLEARLDS